MRPVLPTALLPVLLAVALSGALLSGCGDDGADAPPIAGEPTSASTGPSPTGSSGSSSSSGPTGTPAPGDAAGEDQEEPAAADEAPFPADRAADTATAEGLGLSVVDVRTGSHDGYDRVVFEMGGEGTVGWNVRYEDAPVTAGEGAAVELAGDATLAVTLEGLGLPFENGIEEYAGPRRQSPGLPVVQELQLGGVFEGQYDAFVGVAQDRPFRVFRLSDPQRVVVDVATSG